LSVVGYFDSPLPNCHPERSSCFAKQSSYEVEGPLRIQNSLEVPRRSSRELFRWFWRVAEISREV